MRKQKWLSQREEEAEEKSNGLLSLQDASTTHKISAMLHPASNKTQPYFHTCVRAKLYARRLYYPAALLALVGLLLQQVDTSQSTTLNAALSGNHHQAGRHLQRFEYHLSHLQPPSLVPITVQVGGSTSGPPQNTASGRVTGAAGPHRLLQLQLPLQLHLKLRPLPLPMPPPLLQSLESNGDKHQRRSLAEAPVQLEERVVDGSGLAAAWREAKRVLLLSSISAGLASKLQLLERRSSASDQQQVSDSVGGQLTPTVAPATTTTTDRGTDLGEVSEAQLLRAARGPRLQRHSAPSQPQQRQQPPANINRSQGRSDMEPRPPIGNRLDQDTNSSERQVGQKAKSWRPARSKPAAGKSITAKAPPPPERRRPSYLLDSSGSSQASEYVDSTRLASEYHMPRVKFQLSQRAPLSLAADDETPTGKLGRLIESLAGSVHLARYREPQNNAAKYNQSAGTSPFIDQHPTTTQTTSLPGDSSSRSLEAFTGKSQLIEPQVELTTTSSSSSSQQVSAPPEVEAAAAVQVNSTKVMPELAQDESCNNSSRPATDRHIKLFHFKRKPDMNKLPFYKRPLNYTDLGWTQEKIEEHQRSLQVSTAAGQLQTDDLASSPEQQVSTGYHDSDNNSSAAEFQLLKRKRRGKTGGGSFERLMAELHGQQQPPELAVLPDAIKRRDEPADLVQVNVNGGQRRRLLSLVAHPMILRPIALLDVSYLGGGSGNMSSISEAKTITRDPTPLTRQLMPNLGSQEKSSLGIAPSGEESFLLAPSAQPAEHLPPPPPRHQTKKTNHSMTATLRVPKLLMKPMRPAKYSLNGYIPKPTLSTAYLLDPTGQAGAPPVQQQWPQQVAKMLLRPTGSSMLSQQQQHQQALLNGKDLESSTSNEVFSRRRGLQQQRWPRAHYQSNSMSISTANGHLPSQQLNESNNRYTSQLQGVDPQQQQQQTTTKQLDRAFRLLQLEENKRKYVAQQLAKAKSPTLSAHKAKLIKAKLGLLSLGPTSATQQVAPTEAPTLQPQPKPATSTKETPTSAILTSTSATPLMGLSTIPKTDFECTDSSGRFVAGLFADHKTGCQVWHLCSNNRKYSFLCPVGTVFNAKLRICDWRYNVRCADNKSSPLPSSS